MTEERRRLPRINIGKVNYEAVTAVIGGPAVTWEELTLQQRIALSAAAMAVLAAAENNMQPLWPEEGRSVD